MTAKIVHSYFGLMFASHQQQMLKAQFTDSIALPLNIHLIQRLTLDAVAH